jgi:hypothetical protein
MKIRNQGIKEQKEINILCPSGTFAPDSLNLFENLCAAYSVIYFSYVRNGSKYNF